MKSVRQFRIFGKKLEDISAPVAEALPSAEHESTLLKTVAWVSAGAGALAFGLLVGRELRQRYKFNRRTPYDFYAHSGDNIPDVDFGLGI